MTSLHRHPPRLGSTASSFNASALGAGMIREGFRARSIVRGGGRLFQMSPVEGYTEAEMNQLARERVRYNRKRAALKQMCHTFENSRRAGLVGQIDKVQMERAMAAARLTPRDIPDHLISARYPAAATPGGTNVKGRPVKVAWQGYVEGQLDFPAMPPPKNPELGFKSPRVGGWMSEKACDDC